MYVLCLLEVNGTDSLSLVVSFTPSWRPAAFSRHGVLLHKVMRGNTVNETLKSDIIAVSITDNERMLRLTFFFCKESLLWAFRGKVTFNLVACLQLAALISIILFSDFKGEKSE